MGIGRLREAIRANRVSFPSPIPVFTTRDRPDLQRSLAELYFVRGRDIEGIGAQCGLSFWRVREILNAWKRAAAAAGYLRHAPPEQATLPPPATSQETFVPAIPDVAAPFQNNSSGLPGDRHGIEPGRTAAKIHP